jgi:hypothetical protein
MNRIQARSPYIINIDEVGQTGSKIDLYIYPSNQSLPASPTYTLSKLSPSLTQTSNQYNVSPYVREYINNTVNPNVYNTVGQASFPNFCKVRIVRYKLTLSGYTLLDTTDYTGWNGWGYYEEGTNPVLSNYFLDQKTYYYWYDPSAVLSTDVLKRAGFLTLEVPTGGSIKYTNLVTGAILSAGFGTGDYQSAYRVYPLWYADGNKMEVLSSTSVVLATYYFRPVDECRYDVITIDFINKYGAWQREFMFKASYDSIEVSTNTYQLMQSNLSNYNPVEGMFKEFNLNGRKSIKVNTGSVTEDFKENLTQMGLSERILLNGYPVTMKTRSFDRVKVINKKDINYTLEFQPAYELINTVV